MKQVLLMALSGDEYIACWEIDPENGALTKIAETRVLGRPAPLVLDVENFILYEGLRDIPRIASIKIDPLTGSLDHLADGPQLNSDPCYISLDSTSNTLFGAHYSGGGLSVQQVDRGMLRGDPVWIPTGPGAHCVMTDQSNRSLLLPHIAGGYGINVIKSFAYNEVSGEVSPIPKADINQKYNRGPRHYTYHKNGKFVYFSNEQESSVTVYSYRDDPGSMTEIETKSTLPEGFQGTNTCAQIRMTPDSKFLYAPNRGDDSIAGFAVDPNSGKLTSLGRVDTEPVPRVLDIDHTGQYLYSGGLESGHVSVFNIEHGGQLNFFKRYEVGREPMWLLSVRTE